MQYTGKTIDFGSAELNWGHALAAGLNFLALDYYGSFRVLTHAENSLLPSLVGTAPAVGASPVGTGTAYTTATSVYFDPVAANVAIVGAKSWACGMIKNDAAAPQYTRPFGRTAEFGGSPPFANFDFEVNPFGAGDLTCWATVDSNGTNVQTGGGSPAALPGNNQYIVLGADATPSGNLNFYIDGALAQTATGLNASLPSDDNAGCELIFNGSQSLSATNAMACNVPWGAVWAVALSADQQLALCDILFDDSPSAFILTPRKRSYFYGAIVGSPPLIPAKGFQPIMPAY